MAQLWHMRQAISFIIMGILKILTMVIMQLHQKHHQAHLILLEGAHKTLSNTYVQKGEIMFFNLGGENKTAILSNIGDNDGNDKNEWVFIDSPINY